MFSISCCINVIYGNDRLQLEESYKVDERVVLHIRTVGGYFMVDGKEAGLWENVGKLNQPLSSSLSTSSKSQSIIVFHDADRIPVDKFMNDFWSSHIIHHHDDDDDSKDGFLLILTSRDYLTDLDRLIDFSYPFSASFGSKSDSAQSRDYVSDLNVNNDDDDAWITNAGVKEELFAYAKQVLFSEVGGGYGGALLVGPPGCGKTFMVKALVTHLNRSAGTAVNLVCPSSSDLIHSTFGSSEQALRDLFSRCSQASPCILFLDEVDSLFPQDQDRLEGAKTDSFIVQLMSEFDKLSLQSQSHAVDQRSPSSLLVLAATNFPFALHRALLVPGRWDRILEFTYPTQEERRWYARRKGCPDNRLEEVVEMSKGKSLLYIDGLL